MGSRSFMTKSSGKTAEEAFNSAVHEAQYEYGHGGYTGTIAEKNSFIMVDLPKNTSPRDHAYKLLDDTIVDKWGPAGCFNLGNNEYLFFGWASE